MSFLVLWLCGGREWCPRTVPCEEHQAILDWLTPIDYAPQQSDFIARREKGTGQWLMESEKFQEWLNKSGQTLFCPGIPGAGKTVITSIVVDHLYSKFQNDASVGIAYLYCNFRRQQEETFEAILLSLLKQLIQDRPSVPESVKNLYERHKRKRTRPALDEISKALHSVITGYSRAFIIIDALDECRVSDGGRKQLLSEISNLQSRTLQSRTGVSLFATSRPIPDIMKEFEGRSISLEILASPEDLRRYLGGHMSSLPSFVLRSPDLQEEVKTDIVKAVEGIFLLAELHLGSLIGKRSPKAIRTALKSLSTGSGAYDRAYKGAMERIESQIADIKELAKQVLSWITCARRPLTTSELQNALAVEIDEPKLDKENLPTLDDMVSACAGLVTIDEESDIIRLVHYTTQEYFERTWFPDVQRDIATTCVTYLSFDAFDTGFCPTDEDFEARLQLHPLYDYAARNWGHHARAASLGVEQSILDLLGSEAKVSASSQALMASRLYSEDSDYSQRVPRQMTGVHLAAYFGLSDTVIAALFKERHDADAKEVDVNSKANKGRTPLSLAAENGHEAVVQLLLAKDGADVNSKDNYGQTLLWRAAENGREAVVQLLLAKDGVDVNSKANNGQTPLWRAAENGREAVVQLLLAKGGVDVNSKDYYGRTPLSRAAEKGHEAVVKLLTSIT